MFLIQDEWYDLASLQGVNTVHAFLLSELDITNDEVDEAKEVAEKPKNVSKWAVKFDNGDTHRYTMKQVRSPSLLGCQCWSVRATLVDVAV